MLAERTHAYEKKELRVAKESRECAICVKSQEYGAFWCGRYAKRLEKIVRDIRTTGSTADPLHVRVYSRNHRAMVNAPVRDILARHAGCFTRRPNPRGQVSLGDGTFVSSVIYCCFSHTWTMCN